MQIQVTGSDKKSWYRKDIGKKFTVIATPQWAKEGYTDEGHYVDHPRNCAGIALFILYKHCEVVGQINEANQN